MVHGRRSGGWVHTTDGHTGVVLGCNSTPQPHGLLWQCVNDWAQTRQCRQESRVENEFCSKCLAMRGLGWGQHGSGCATEMGGLGLPPAVAGTVQDLALHPASSVLNGPCNPIHLSGELHTLAHAACLFILGIAAVICLKLLSETKVAFANH